MLSNQEIFDRVCTHLAAQKVQAVVFDDNGNRNCVYRGPNGVKCAVGCLIEDAEYDARMENAPVGALVEEFNFKNFNENQRQLLTDLQYAHDNASSLWRLKGLLERCAEEWGLSGDKVVLIEEWSPRASLSG